jgi:hypothetical protein
METKGLDYAGLHDANFNFKDVAKSTGLTAFQVWMVYTKKHVDRIFNSIKANPSNPCSHGETLEESTKDIINYMGILDTLLMELKEPEFIQTEVRYEYVSKNL